jgi:hypothetical protein
MGQGWRQVGDCLLPDPQQPTVACQPWGTVYLCRQIAPLPTLYLLVFFAFLGSDLPPFLNFCPYTWEGEIFHSSRSLEISIFIKKFFAKIRVY